VESKASFDSLSVYSVSYAPPVGKVSFYSTVMSYWFSGLFQYEINSVVSVSDNDKKPSAWYPSDAGIMQTGKDEKKRIKRIYKI